MAELKRPTASDRIVVLEKMVKDLAEQRDEMRRANEAAHKDAKQIHQQFDDLKTRLHDSEMENQRLRGYVQRVQEDDTVREELVAVGDPNGEQTMVPKRKSTVFFQPNPMTQLQDAMGPSSYTGYNRDRPKPKHWVNY